MRIKFYMKDHLLDLMNYIEEKEKNKLNVYVINKSYIQESYMDSTMMKRVVDRLKRRNHDVEDIFTDGGSEFTFLKEFAKINGTIVLYPDPEPLSNPTKWETIPSILKVDYIEDNDTVIVMGSSLQDGYNGVVLTRGNIGNMLSQVYDNIFLKLDSGKLYEQEQKNIDVFQLQLFYMCIGILDINQTDARYNETVYYEDDTGIKKQITYRTKNIAKVTES